jgi:ABC-2 type transport system permease protein
MRTGRRPKATAAFRFEQLDRTQKTIAGWYFGFGAVPLIPQGIIAAVFVANGILRHS